MRKVLVIASVVLILLQAFWVMASENRDKVTDLLKRFESTADHKKFKELQVDFNSTEEVTKACLKCHTEAAKQIHKDIHWTWDFKDGSQELGKRISINNF